MTYVFEIYLVYAQTLIVVNLIVVKIFVFSFITVIISGFWGEPRVVSDTPGYGGADSGIGGGKNKPTGGQKIVFL